MKKLTLSLLLIGGSLFASNGENLFMQKCSMCHVTTPPQDRNALVAPPIFGVMRHVKMSYPTKEKAMVFMNDYVMNPSKEKSICKPQKIEKFGLMPAQKGNVTPKELEIITSWIYDNFPPKGFRGGGMMRAK
jgi:hypothetical protein